MPVPKFDPSKPYGTCHPIIGNVAFSQNGFHYDPDGEHIPLDSDPDPNAVPVQKVKKQAPPPVPAAEESTSALIDALPDESGDEVNEEGEEVPNDPRGQLRAWAKGQVRLQFFSVKKMCVEVFGESPANADSAKKMIATLG